MSRLQYICFLPFAKTTRSSFVKSHLVFKRFESCIKGMSSNSNNIFGFFANEKLLKLPTHDPFSNQLTKSKAMRNALSNHIKVVILKEER